MKKVHNFINHCGNTNVNLVKMPIIAYTSDCLKLSRMTMSNVDTSTEQLDHSHSAGGNVKWYNHLEISLPVSHKIKHIFII